MFSSRKHSRFELARTTCIDEMEDSVSGAELTQNNSYKPAVFELLNKLMPSFMYPTVHLLQPLFVGTGLSDNDVNPAAQKQLVKDSCATGTIVEAHWYTGPDHSQAVNGSLKDSLPFVHKIFAGEPITPNCTPTPE